MANGILNLRKEHDMEFKELIEARRSVRKYVASEISKAEVEVVVGEAMNAPSWRNTEVTR